MQSLARDVVMGRRVIAVLAAVLVGLVGVVAVLLYASGANSRAVADQQPETVFLAQQIVPAGTTAADAVAKGLMVPTKVAAKGVPVGALTSVDASYGKLVALTDIASGEFVMASLFGVTAQGEKAIQVPDGQVALSVSLSDPGGVGTFLTPGSRVVIYDTFTPDLTSGTTNPVKETRVLIDDALIIAVGSAVLSPTGGQSAAASSASQNSAGALVTVALPPLDAANLVHGIQTGTLYAALRGSNTHLDTAQIVTDSTLFHQ
jgi:pilus assembly protein CpaB